MEEQPSAATSSIVQGSNTYSDVYEFLKLHTIKKNSQEKISHTNTRIGDAKSNIYGGNYNIPDIEYPVFLELYHRDIISKNKKEYLTEKQRENDGPLLIDLDFRYSYDVDEKQYTNEQVEDFLTLLLEELKEIYQFDENIEFSIFVLEKPTVNRIAEKKITKDGIHIILCAQIERGVQLYIREKIIKQLNQHWDLPIINTWEDVYDEGVTKGTVNWQLYGSRKPNHDKYSLTRLFKVSYDDSDGELMMSEQLLSQFDIEKNMNKLSVRYKNHISLFMKNDFMVTYNDFKKKNNIGTETNTASRQLVNPIIANRDRSDMYINNVGIISSIRNQEELDLAINSFIQNVSESLTEYELKTLYDYVMVLPENYYGMGSYDKWIRVGWALKNTSEKLLIVWLAFSAKSPTFQFSEVSDICERWINFKVRTDGLSKLSIIHWVKTDCKSEFDKIFRSTLDYYVELTLNGNRDKYKPPDYDLATVLYQFKKHEYVCISVKNNQWFKYKDNRWVISDSGIHLRSEISNPVRELYNNKSINLMQDISTIRQNTASIMNQDDNEDNEQTDINKKKSIQCIDIVTRLGQSSDKGKIMTECKELFYDGRFLKKLDTNQYLLCFKNGVIDFKEKTFRKGQPEDYISMCTNIDYIKLTSEHKDTIDEIHVFMKQLFPKPELCKYMWEHLASCLIGTAPNQTFNQYYGAGQNGKSVLVNLMEKCLGDYKGDVPLTLVTGRRQNVGNSSPEIASLKGIRFAVMQEPSKDDVINEGVLKQYTSGKDPIQGRALFCDPVTFYPQFKLIVTCNVMMKINSNDHGTWRRQRLVPFESLFTEDPVDDDDEKPYQFKLDRFIDEKFDRWAPVFMSMLVDIAFEKNGVVDDCDIVLAKTKEYRQSQDYLSEFIRDRIVKDSDGKIRKTELNNEFSIWYASNHGGKTPSPKDLHEYIDKEFGRIKNQAWRGIRIRYESNDDDDDINEEEDEESDISSSELN